MKKEFPNLEKMKSLIGKESVPKTILVSEREIKRFAQAIGDLNPLYLDREFAQRSRYGGIIAPPLFIFALDYYGDLPETELGPDGMPVSEELELPLPPSYVRGGSSEIEFFRPIKAGDSVTVRKKLVDVYTKEGKSGPLLFVVIDTIVADQKGEPLVIERGTFIRSLIEKAEQAKEA